MKIADSTKPVQFSPRTPAAATATPAAGPTDTVATSSPEQASDARQMAKMAVTGVGGLILAVPCAYAGLAGGALVGGVLGGALGPVTSAMTSSGLGSAMSAAWHSAGSVGHAGLFLGGATALVGAFSLSNSLGKLITHEHASTTPIKWANPATIAVGTTLLTAGISAGAVGGLALAGGAAGAATIASGLIQNGFTAAALSGLGHNALTYGLAGAVTAGTVGVFGAAALTKGIARHVIDPASNLLPAFKEKVAAKIDQRVDEAVTKQADKQVPQEIAKKLPGVISARVEAEMASPAKQAEIDEKVTNQVAQRADKAVEDKATALINQQVAEKVPALVSAGVDAQIKGPKAAEIAERTEIETAKRMDQEVAQRVETAIQAKTDEKVAQLLPQEVEKRAQEAIAGPRAQEVKDGVEAKIASTIAAQAAAALAERENAAKVAADAKTYMTLANSQCAASYENAATTIKTGLAVISASANTAADDKLLANACLTGVDSTWALNGDDQTHRTKFQYHNLILQVLTQSKADNPAGLDPKVFYKISGSEKVQGEGVRYRASSAMLRTGLDAMRQSPKFTTEQKALINTTFGLKMESWQKQYEHYHTIMGVLAGVVK